MGSVCVIGEEFGKIKQVLCDGKNVKRAVAGDTVQITGINRNVNSGEWLMEVKNEAEALEVVNYRKRRRERQSAIQKKQGDASEVEAEEEEKDVVLRAKLYYLLGYPTSAMNILRVNVGVWE